MKEHISVRSFRAFINDWLPAELAKVVPLADYRVETTASGAGRVSLTLVSGTEHTSVVFDDLPVPHEDGTFFIDGQERVVVMTASSNNLAEAEIRAVGEQLRDEMASRLSAPPQDIVWDEEMLRAWFPLDRWLRSFLLESATSWQVEAHNTVDRKSYMQRITIQGTDVSFHPSHIGRVCPYETPEGLNHGRIVTLAMGADVKDGKIVPAQNEDGSLSYTASLVPLLCHNDSVRQLIGVNMMRQWLPLPNPEPPLVCSGNEPDDGSAFLGRNFLTAYMHWKGITNEDAVVISESAAALLASPEPLEVGDKISNRHGAKSVIGAILPDSEMPHLLDGRPVELIYDSIGLHTRLNFGQVIEAAMGLVAEKNGNPVIASPFRRTAPGELHDMLRNAGLPESGQFVLLDGKNGEPLDEPTTLGMVYWGKLIYRSRRVIDALPDLLTITGRMEYAALLSVGAIENILDVYSTRSPMEEDVLRKVAGGFLAEHAPPPSAAFRRLQGALRTAMIQLDWQDEQAAIAWAALTENDIALAEPVPHPWYPVRMLTHLDLAYQDSDAYQNMLSANEHFAKSLQSAHPAVQNAARTAFHQALNNLFAELEADCEMKFSQRSLFTARAVLSPGYDITLGEIGLPEEIAWFLFGPLVVEKVGEEAVQAHTEKALKEVEALMQESVVVINRAPTFEPMNITAFTPRITATPTIRLHPLCCRLFNADFDGDQAAVWLPVTIAAQNEAKEKLTLTGHLQRDPYVVIAHLAPAQAVMAGLAYALETSAGQAEFAEAWPVECEQPSQPLTRSGLIAGLHQVFVQLGSEQLLDLIERLYHLGTAWATKSGASLSPFIGEGVQLPAFPSSDYAASWDIYRSLVDEAIYSQTADDLTLQPPMRIIQCGARGSITHLRALIGPWTVTDPYDINGPIKSGFRDGFSSHELWLWAARCWAQLQRVNEQQVFLAGKATGKANAQHSFLLRAMQAAQPCGDMARKEHPGQVFASAAEEKAVDALTDTHVRLWTGLRL